MRSFEEFFLLEYRHNLSDGTTKPSVHAHNGKNPNNLDKKILHTVGPYDPKNDELHRVGAILVGDNLLALLADQGLDFKAGEISKIKNSPHAIQMYINKRNQPVGRVIKIK